MELDFFGSFIKMICYIRERNFADSFIYTISCLEHIDDNKYIEFQNNVLTSVQIIFREIGDRKTEDIIFQKLKDKIDIFDYRPMLQIHLTHYAIHFELYEELCLLVILFLILL